MSPLSKKTMLNKHKFNVYDGRPASNTADYNQVQYFHAKVVKQLGEESWLLDNRKIAQRAFSCLIVPLVGDTVIYASTDDSCSITTVLARVESEQNKAQLSVSQQTELELRAQKLTLAAEQEMALQTAGNLSINAALGKLVLITADMVQQVQHSFIQTCKQLISRMDYSDVQAKEMLKTHSRNQIMTADKDIRVDADRINMG